MWQWCHVKDSTSLQLARFTRICTHTHTPIVHWILCLAIVRDSIQPLFLPICEHSSPSPTRGEILHSNQQRPTFASPLCYLLLCCEDLLNEGWWALIRTTPPLVWYAEYMYIISYYCERCLYIFDLPSDCDTHLLFLSPEDRFEHSP